MSKKRTLQYFKKEQPDMKSDEGTPKKEQIKTKYQLKRDQAKMEKSL